MVRILLLAGVFVGGIWFAYENPSVGRAIKAYADAGIFWLNQFIGG